MKFHLDGEFSAVSGDILQAKQDVMQAITAIIGSQSFIGDMTLFPGKILELA